MSKIYSDFSLDFNENRSLQIVRLKQNENCGRILRIALYNNGERVNLENYSIVVVNASVKGVVTAYDFPCSIENNMVNVNICPPLTTLAGTELCEIKLLGSTNAVLYTATFEIKVEPSVASTNSPAVLKSTDLARTLKDHEARIEALEQELGGSIGGNMAVAMQGTVTPAPVLAQSEIIFDSEVE